MSRVTGNPLPVKNTFSRSTRIGSCSLTFANSFLLWGKVGCACFIGFVSGSRPCHGHDRNRTSAASADAGVPGVHTVKSTNSWVAGEMIDSQPFRGLVTQKLTRHSEAKGRLILIAWLSG